MEHVVYILGAGFSVPLGLPVVNNFLERSKDLYFSDPRKYGYFEKIFSKIDELSVCKNVFHTNLHNIEEILSLLEMESLVSGKSEDRELFQDFIADVIKASTRSVPDSKGEKRWTSIFPSDIWFRYGTFVAALLNCTLQRSTYTISQSGNKLYRYEVTRFAGLSHAYSVISLNYDLVLEHMASCLNSFKSNDIDKISFESSPMDLHGRHSCCLAKLHGSVDRGNIIPPTWNKGMVQDVEDAWSLAAQLLERANHIRFVGYSLPEADNYVRYLLRASIARRRIQHLKSIDVVCLDPDGSVRKRFKDFINHPRLRFAELRFEEFLDAHRRTYDENLKAVKFNRLEQSHENCIAFKHL